MSTIKDFLCLLLVVTCNGIAGRMDYDDPLLLNKAQRHPALTVETDCTAVIPVVSESNGREAIDPGDAPTNADHCVME